MKILAPKLAFWPQISTQKAKFDQKYFFRDPEAPRFPTRGHMPMFEKIRKNSIFRSRNGSSGPNFEEPEFSGQIALRQFSLVLVL